MVRERNLSLFSLYILSLILVEESDYISILHSLPSPSLFSTFPNSN